MLAATSTPAALRNKAAATTIPIVFTTGSDPVRLGLVASLNRPGGNITGATQLNMEVAPKRLELLHELLPTATDIAVLVNPANPLVAETETRALRPRPARLALSSTSLMPAPSVSSIRSSQAWPKRGRADSIGTRDAFFNARADSLAPSPAATHCPQSITVCALPAAADWGATVAGSYPLAAAFLGRILKGEKPADLPVQQSTKVEMIINLKTAKALGLTVPLPLLGRADEVIE